VKVASAGSGGAEEGSGVRFTPDVSWVLRKKSVRLKSITAAEAVFANMRIPAAIDKKLLIGRISPP
jgi:hypothetical protein